MTLCSTSHACRASKPPRVQTTHQTTHRFARGEGWGMGGGGTALRPGPRSPSHARRPDRVSESRHPSRSAPKRGAAGSGSRHPAPAPRYHRANLICKHFCSFSSSVSPTRRAQRLSASRARQSGRRSARPAYCMHTKHRRISA